MMIVGQDAVFNKITMGLAELSINGLYVQLCYARIILV